MTYTGGACKSPVSNIIDFLENMENRSPGEQHFKCSGGKGTLHFKHEGTARLK